MTNTTKVVAAFNKLNPDEQRDALTQLKEICPIPGMQMTRDLIDDVEKECYESDVRMAEYRDDDSAKTLVGSTARLMLAARTLSDLSSVLSAYRKKIDEAKAKVLDQVLQRQNQLVADTGPWPRGTKKADKQATAQLIKEMPGVGKFVRSERTNLSVTDPERLSRVEAAIGYSLRQNRASKDPIQEILKTPAAQQPALLEALGIKDVDDDALLTAEDLGLATTKQDVLSLRRS